MLTRLEIIYATCRLLLLLHHTKDEQRDTYKGINVKRMHRSKPKTKHRVDPWCLPPLLLRRRLLLLNNSLLQHNPTHYCNTPLQHTIALSLSLSDKRPRDHIYINIQT